MVIVSELLDIGDSKICDMAFRGFVRCQMCEKRGNTDMKPLCRICGNWISLERDEYHMLGTELIHHECLMRKRLQKRFLRAEEKKFRNQ